MRAIIIGAGPAGLASSQQLKERGIEHVVLERGESVGQSWANLYDSLTLHTGKHMSALPGMKFPRSAPLFLPRGMFLQYLHDYRENFSLPIQTGTTVRSVLRSNGRWQVETSKGTMESDAVIVATGIISGPRVPSFKGQESFTGRIRHSIEYRRPDDLHGKRVLVIGAGNSAGEIASELAQAGIDTTIAIRSGANVVPLRLLGIPIQYCAYLMRKLPRRLQDGIVGAMRLGIDFAKGPPPIPRPPYGPLDSIPLIGFHLVDAIRSGRIKVRGGVDEITPRGVRFADGSEMDVDEILLATGFRAPLGILHDLVGVDEKGFGQRRDRVVSTDQPNLFFVGHNYDATGGLFNIRRDARLVAGMIARG